MADELTIKHNGVDITDKLDLNSCLLYDKYGGGLDTISLAFPQDTNITINRMDKLEVRFGYYQSGVMHIDNVESVDKIFKIHAISAKPVNKAVKTNIWRYIGLLQIAADVAGKCGLQLKSYDVTNHIYEAVYQKNETDLQFLMRICEREGYCVKCDNECLIIYNQYEIENNPEKKMTLSADEVSGDWDFERSINGLASYTVSCFDSESGMQIEYTATDNGMPDGGSKRTVEKVTADEAVRFAKGYLRANNKNHITGYIEMDIKTNISACTVIELSGFNEFDGTYIAYDVLHDVVRKKTVLKIRQILNY